MGQHPGRAAKCLGGKKGFWPRLLASLRWPVLRRTSTCDGFADSLAPIGRRETPSSAHGK
eukprot:14670163-Alexandrium_andersonii.AAC.1